MPVQNRINSGKPQPVHTHQDNWNVMRPFVHFAWGATKMIGLGLISIVKALPLLKHQQLTQPQERSRTIKVR